MNLVKNDKLVQLDIVMQGKGKLKIFALTETVRIFAVYNLFDKIGEIQEARMSDGTFSECAKNYEETVQRLLGEGFECWEPTDWTSSYNFGISISGCSGNWTKV